MKQAGVADMMFLIPAIGGSVSTPTFVSPGAGAKRNPPLWMEPGDEMIVDICGVERLRNTVVVEV